MIIQPEIPERMTSQCAICSNNELSLFYVREMQIGFREVFKYGRCNKCGAITRLSEITEISRYYPPNYYSFDRMQSQPQKKGIKSWLRNRRDRALLTKGVDPVGRILGWRSQETTRLYRILGECQINLSSSILDVGCGSGQLLRRMAEVGFKKLIGVDLFIPEIVHNTVQNPLIIKGDLKKFEGEHFDLIMMHHSLEHCEDQYTELKLARDLLAPNGVLLVRQPVCDSDAFRRYGANWFQLDAPRHAVVHSLDSMELLVKACGLKIKNILWDSTDQQFWASEQYAADVATYDEKSYFQNPELSQFTSTQIALWKKEGDRLNRASRGDQAAWYILPEW